MSSTRHGIADGGLDDEAKLAAKEEKVNAQIEEVNEKIKELDVRIKEVDEKIKMLEDVAAKHDAEATVIKEMLKAQEPQEKGRLEEDLAYERGMVTARRSEIIELRGEKKELRGEKKELTGLINELTGERKVLETQKERLISLQLADREAVVADKKAVVADKEAIAAERKEKAALAEKDVLHMLARDTKAIRLGTSTSTKTALAPEAEAAQRYEGAFRVTTVEEMFAEIELRLFDRADRLSSATSERPCVMTPAASSTTIRPLLIAKTLKEEAQYDVVNTFVQEMGEERHFAIHTTSKTSYLTDSRTTKVFVDQIGMKNKTSRLRIAPISMGFVIEHKAEYFKGENPTSPHLDAVGQLEKYMFSVLRACGPNDPDDPHCDKRTHVIGILVYREAAKEEDVKKCFDPNKAATPLTWPVIKRFSGRDMKTSQGKRRKYDRLVAEVFVRFHPSFVKFPHLIRLATLDAAQLFYELCHPSTEYAYLDRLFGVNAFKIEQVGDNRYACARYLGLGSIGDVWAVFPGDSQSSQLIEHHPDRRYSTDSHEESRQAEPGLLVLKRAARTSLSSLDTDPSIKALQHEASMLRKLAAMRTGEQRHGTISTEILVGSHFPELIYVAADALLMAPVCYKIVSGGLIRDSAADSEKKAKHQTKLGKIFADYVATLEFCHRHRIVHCDIAVRNLMVTPDGRGCIVDWNCAEEVEVGKDTIKFTRGSLETASSQVLMKSLYGFEDDLIALVRCWAITTDLDVYEAVKQWSSKRRGRIKKSELAETTLAYWDEAKLPLEKFAAERNYSKLRSFFADPLEAASHESEYESS